MGNRFVESSIAWQTLSLQMLPSPHSSSRVHCSFAATGFAGVVVLVLVDVLVLVLVLVLVDEGVAVGAGVAAFGAALAAGFGAGFVSSSSGGIGSACATRNGSSDAPVFCAPAPDARNGSSV